MRLLLAITSTILFAIAATQAEPAKIQFEPSDTVQSTLAKQGGQRVELHLRSGEKLTGKLETAGSKGVHLSAIAGQEFFDAVVATDDISAVLVRTK